VLLPPRMRAGWAGLGRDFLGFFFFGLSVCGLFARNFSLLSSCCCEGFAFFTYVIGVRNLWLFGGAWI
jgi:hypothetical protein